MTDTNLRILSLQLDTAFFAVSYHRSDWSRAIAAVCRWKELELIDAADQEHLARLILTRASLDGELKRPVQRRPVGVLQRLVAMLCGGKA
jgi:hypothetical protein